MASFCSQKVTALAAFDRQSVAVHKFGGSSLSTRPRLRNVVNIISDQTCIEDFIVVSANGEITDWLLTYIAGEQDVLQRIEAYYQELVCSLIEFPKELIEFFHDSIFKIKNGTLSTEAILAFGEIWSARLLVELLNQQKIPALYIDARDLLKTDSIECHSRFDDSYFDTGITKTLYGNYGKRLVVTGFIAKNRVNETITLGRNGSDYTATLLAKFSLATAVTLWTDVKGIYSADPRLVKSAQPIKTLSYSEAKALAAVGTNVLHAKTIYPLEENRIPLLVKASVEPLEQGSIVQQESESPRLIKSVALRNDLIKISLRYRDGFNQKQLLHELFEQHIHVFVADSSVAHSSLSLLVDRASLASAERILESKQLDFHVNQDPRVLIGIVGKKLRGDPVFLSHLKHQLDDSLCYRLIESEFTDLVSLVVRVDNSVKALNQIYQICAVNSHVPNFTDSSQNDLILEAIGGMN